MRNPSEVIINGKTLNDEQTDMTMEDFLRRWREIDDKRLLF